MTSPTRLTLVSFAVLAVTLAACRRPAEENKTEPPVAAPALPTAAPATTATEGGEQLALAFGAAWGRAAPFRDAPEEECFSGCFLWEPGGLIPLDGDRVALLSTGQGYQSHASAGALSIHYLERTRDGFRRLAVEPLVLEGGQYGNWPTWSVRRDLLTHAALIANGGGSGQGYSCGAADIIELTPDRPVRRAERVRLDFSNGGAVENPDEVVEMEGRILPGASGRDFIVQYSGASQARVTWRLGADGLFRPVNEPDDLPWC